MPALVNIASNTHDSSNIFLTTDSYDKGEKPNHLPKYTAVILVMTTPLRTALCYPRTLSLNVSQVIMHCGEKEVQAKTSRMFQESR